MAVPPSKIFAVLVGIDEYFGQVQNNLNGCVNDVLKVKSFLEKSTGVPAENISTLLSPRDSKPVELPTKNNVVQLIKTVAQMAVAAGPNSVLLFHYSGHGIRMKTKYGQLKKGSYDEAMCTLDEFLTDVEFSELLDELAKQPLSIFITLDCCHSGGADRIGDDSAAVRSAELVDPKNVYTGTTAESYGDGDGRNAGAEPSWFYRVRHHNLIAACQPHESAWERYDAQNKKTGIMTDSLIKALDRFKNANEPVTYGILTDHMVAIAGAPTAGLRAQQPLHLGERNRLLFSSQVTTQSSTGYLQANVTFVAVGSKKVTLDKGSAHGIQQGDVFFLYTPDSTRFGVPKAEAQHAAEVQVETLEDLKVTATLLTKDATPQKGWFALLSRPARPPVVQITSINHPDAIEKLRQEWAELVSSPNPPPVDVRFAPGLNAESKDPVALHIDTSADDLTLKFLNGSREPLDHVPTLQLDDTNLVKKLAYLIPHLCSYQRLSNLKPLNTPPKTPAYEFTMELKGTKANPALGDFDNPNPNAPPQMPYYEVNFRNKAQVPLYLTILNLGPVYGISQIYPLEAGSSAALSPGEGMEPLQIDIAVPNLLLDDASTQPGFQMHDKFKALITSKETDFRQYLQADLVDWETWARQLADGELDEGTGRNGIVYRPPNVFWVDEREIVTTREHLYEEA